MTFRTALTGAATASLLAACGGIETTRVEAVSVRTGDDTAESACTTAVNTNMPGRGATVVSSQASGDGTLVVLRSGEGTNWRCLASGNGVVEELSII